MQKVHCTRHTHTHTHKKRKKIFNHFFQHICISQPPYQKEKTTQSLFQHFYVFDFLACGFSGFGQPAIILIPNFGFDTKNGHTTRNKLH